MKKINIGDTMVGQYLIKTEYRGNALSISSGKVKIVTAAGKIIIADDALVLKLRNNVYKILPWNKNTSYFWNGLSDNFNLNEVVEHNKNVTVNVNGKIYCGREIRVTENEVKVSESFSALEEDFQQESVSPFVQTTNSGRNLEVSVFSNMDINENAHHEVPSMEEYGFKMELRQKEKKVANEPMPSQPSANTFKFKFTPPSMTKKNKEFLLEVRKALQKVDANNESKNEDIVALRSLLENCEKEKTMLTVITISTIETYLAKIHEGMQNNIDHDNTNTSPISKN